jgi:hypothetical protein
MNTPSYPKTQKLTFGMLAFVLLASMLLALPARAQSTTSAVPIMCIVKCLRVADTSLTKIADIGSDAIDPISPQFVTAIVTVKQTPSVGSLGSAPGAKVYAMWTLPDGSQIKAVGSTNTRGQAFFRVEQISDPSVINPGSYTFTVLDVVKENFTFDKLNSILTKSIK